MSILTSLIINICMLSTDPKCVETLFVCMRDNFEINFYDDLSWQQELVLPTQLKWCVDHE
jgi:hypothetical protein